MFNLIFFVGLSANSGLIFLEERAEHLFHSLTSLNLESITIQSTREEMDNENGVENVDNNHDENFKLKSSSKAGKYYFHTLNNFNSDYLSKYINLCPNEFNLKEIQSKCQQLNGRKSDTDGNHLFEKGNEKRLKIKSEKVKKNKSESLQSPYCTLLLQECSHMNRLISRIKSDFNLVERSLSGLCDVTEDIENIMMCLGASK